MGELLQLVEEMDNAAGEEVLEKTVAYLYDGNGNQVRQQTGYLRPHSRDMRQVTGANPVGNEITGDISTLLEKVSNTFDGFNRLKKAERTKAGEQNMVEYTYDGDDLRTRKVVRSSKDGYAAKVTNYTYDRQYVILETDDSGNATVRYVHGINYIARIDASNKLSYYLFNGHGDVMQTVSESGAVENQYDYDIFGNPTLTIEMYAASIRYAGEFYDAEVGLYYLRARYYDPYIGRFISEDTYEGKINDPLSLNRYTYAKNDPLLYVDPTGHHEEVDGFGSANGKTYQQVTGKTLEQMKKEQAAEAKKKDDAAKIKAADANKKTMAEAAKKKATEIGTGFLKTVTNTVTSIKKITTNTTVAVKNVIASPVISNTVQKVSKTVNDFVGGVAIATDNNVFFGTAQLLSGGVNAPKTTAYKVGKVAGDVVSFVSGAAGLLTAGTGITVGGGLTLAAPVSFGTTAIVGVPVVAGSLLLGAASGSAVIKSTSNGLSDIKDLFSFSKGMGEGAKNIFGRDASKTINASDVRDYAKSQGWTKTRTQNGPEKWVDENGVARITIKVGSDKAPGSADPHIEIKDSSGQRIDPLGNSVNRKSDGNHTPINLD